MKIMIGETEFDTVCPSNCPGKKDPVGQGGLCYRCPIFNCAGSSFESRLLEPEDYRPDLAKIWRKWFDTGMKGYPELPLLQAEPATKKGKQKDS